MQQRPVQPALQERWLRTTRHTFTCSSLGACHDPPPVSAEDSQLVVHTQHSPLPMLHGPTDDVTSQGADTLVSKDPELQSQVSPHTATVLAAAHTQHSPLPTVQLPVDDCTVHGADSLATPVPSQSQVSPHTATVGVCVTWTSS
jgi:hypothetical protein